MRLLLRFLGFLVLILSSAVFIGCVAGIFGVWKARQDLSEKTRQIVTRVEGGLKHASAANRNVGLALEKARAELAKVHKESSDLAGAEKKRRSPGLLQRLVRQEVGPKLDDLGGRVAVSSDAAIVVAAFLQSLQELPLSQTSRITPERLERLTDRSTQLSASLQKLQALVNEGGNADAEKENADATREVDLVLRSCQTTVDEWQTDLDSGLTELPQIEAEILGWLTFLAFAVTVVCAWVALSQISLFAHALKWCRGSENATSR